MSAGAESALQEDGEPLPEGGRDSVGSPRVSVSESSFTGDEPATNREEI